MQARVGAMYGAFGGKQSGPTKEELDPLVDNHLRPTLKLFGAVAAISAALTLTVGTTNILVNIVAGLAFSNLSVDAPFYLAGLLVLPAIFLALQARR